MTAAYTDVKTLSYHVDNHDVLLAMHMDVSFPLPVYIIGGLESRRAYTISVLAYTVADGPRSIHLTAVTRESKQLVQKVYTIDTASDCTVCTLTNRVV